MLASEVLLFQLTRALHLSASTQLADVPAQRQALLDILSQHKQVAVADLAITETVFVLEKSLGVPRKSVAQFLDALIANQHLNLNRALLRRVIPHYQEHPAVSFNDCCLEAYAALGQQTPLYTFDKKLARQLPQAELV